MTELRNYLTVTILYFLLKCIWCISLPHTSVLSEVELEEMLKNILASGANLKYEISKLEESDFLKKYEGAIDNEDKYLNITQLVTKYGYKLHTYHLVTEDGYKIVAQRIPGDGDAVLLVHGLLNSAIDWFTIGRESALPCLLADLGYDVWLFNARGTTEDSRGHERLDAEKDDAQYWDFSWDEIGFFDLPATIDLVLKQTSKQMLKLVGFSQGTTCSYVLTSRRPEYNSKISLIISLAPAAWMSNIDSPILKLLSPAVEPLSGVIRNIIGFTKFDGNNPLIKLFTKYICGNSETAIVICESLVFLLFGFDYEQVNATQIPVIFGHTPSTVSTKQIFHYVQEINSGKFERYDYGMAKNMKRYGTVDPPSYPVEKITAPVALIYKHNDWVSAYEDVHTLRNKLPNVVDFYEPLHNAWCHADYIWAKDVKQLVYKRVLELLEKY